MFTAPVTHLRLSDPRSISGCKCWLRSDLGITTVSGAVSTWANQASNGSAANATQSSSSLRPTYSSGGLNGRPKLVFDGTKGMQWALDLQGAKTLIIIAKLNAEAHSGYSLYSLKGSTGPAFSELMLDLNTYQYNSVVADITVSSNFTSFGHNDVWGSVSGHVDIVTYNGSGNTNSANYGANLDGVTKTLVNSGLFGRVSTDLGSIGSRLNSSNATAFGANADIYELIVYNRVLTSDEQTQLYKYAKALYGL